MGPGDQVTASLSLGSNSDSTAMSVPKQVMGPGDQVTASLSLGSNSDSTAMSVPKQVMGPGDQVTASLSLGSNSDSTAMSVPKLHDDGSNWSDYQPKIERVLGSKGLWRHVLGTATAPKPYALLAGVPVLADGKTPATEDQIESKEDKITDFDKTHVSVTCIH
jgi:hypothetical protein